MIFISRHIRVGVAQGIAMPYNRPMKRLSMVLLLLLILAACTSTQEQATPLPPEPTATAAPLIPLASPEPLDLTIWLPEWMLSENPEATQIIEETIWDFSAEQGVEVEIIVKPASGPSGLYDFLEKTYPVAPAVLPDLIALPFKDVGKAADKGFLQPLDGLLSTNGFSDLYPFAQEVARNEDLWLSAPFTADFEHLAFQPSALSDLPLNWSVVLESGVHYAFPAGGSEATLTDALLLHYLSAVGEAGDPDRNEQALRATLDFYEAIASNGLLDDSSLQARDASVTWPRALQGTAELAHTTAHLWSRDKNQATTLRFGPVPTADGVPRYIPHGWAYGIVTADPQRQALAAQLIDRLVAPGTLGAWSTTANRLPTQRAALDLWPGDDFTLFAEEALEVASREPLTVLLDTNFNRNLHTAMLDVLSGATDAESATNAAVADW